MSYANPQDLVSRFDARTLGDLCQDAGNRTTQAGLATDPNLQTTLDDASGDIDAALLQGQRYAPADLDGLQGNSLNKLKRVCCDIAFGYLWERRPWRQEQEPHPAYTRGQSALEKLRKGENVFNIFNALDAGIPENTGPSSVDLSQLQTLTQRTRNYYPVLTLPNFR
ncbi:MAG: DUF1320 family protein [Patescibacteria group bacterium]|nr:DUF1320 family protein [Patescibacteria group bacterium]